jgi:adenylylsulfate kinase-like enzyme
MNDETPIDYETHVKTFKKYYDKLDAPKLIINTSENTMYKCCIKILKYVEKVNNLEGMFNLAKE